MGSNGLDGIRGSSVCSGFDGLGVVLSGVESFLAVLSGVIWFCVL